MIFYYVLIHAILGKWNILADSGTIPLIPTAVSVLMNFLETYCPEIKHPSGFRKSSFLSLIRFTLRAVFPLPKNLDWICDTD